MLASIPLFIEFEEPDRLDPTRIGLTWELPPASRPAMRVHSPLTSLAVHLLPLLLILGWPRTPGDIAPPMAVELVFEEPPTAPDTPSPQQDHLLGRLASEDLGDTKPKDPGSAPQQTPSAPGEKAPAPAPAQAAVAPIPPVPPPKPAPPKEPAPVSQPKPAGVQMQAREETPHEAPRAARNEGPSASRDEYFAYMLTLTRQHLDLLPLSVIGNRRGETIVTVVLGADGTIIQTGVARSSGYADIDQRIVQMVKAVGKFPPVPQWFKGNAMDTQLLLRFPDALERSP
jgi:TonB family protein